MSGGFVPYHLRPGKAVDRKLFIEALQLLSRRKQIKDYTYIGFGGPFLEDFKQIHSEVLIKDMISLEEDENIVDRQMKNRPFSCIDCRNQKSEDFIDSFDIEGNVVIWLDYASKKIDEQLGEFRQLLPKLQAGDVVKITLNANVETLGTPAGHSRKDIKNVRYQNLRSKVKDYLRAGLTADEISQKNYPDILVEAVLHAAYLSFEKKKLSFYPMVACTYQDTQRMVTVTGVIEENEGKEEILKEEVIGFWPFLYDSAGVLDIRLPVLSLKERLEIDSEMPSNDAEEVQRQLGFYVHEDKGMSLDMIRNYMKFYRHYPQFSRVVV